MNSSWRRSRKEQTAKREQQTANEADALPQSKAQADGAADFPHLYQPAASSGDVSYETLFDLAAAPGYYNAAKKAALLRRGKRPSLDELFIDFAGPDVRVALTAADQPLVSGVWSWQATAAGQPLVAVGPWEEVCWHQDRAADFLEIELPLTGGWRLERTMVLARQDRFLWLADALLGPQPTACELHYASRLPLAGGCKFAPAAETREGALVAGGRRRAMVVPPALAEWRAEFCHAELGLNDGALRLQQAALGRNLYAPLWIDLDPDRLRRPLTWRRLTVGENLAIMPRDVATGYRLQVGDEQWLIYRSLDPVGNRSVLGLNTVSSFVCLRFFTSGKTQEVVAIE